MIREVHQCRRRSVSSYSILVRFLPDAATFSLTPRALGHGEGLDLLAVGLQIYAFGASFGLGALANALSTEG
ncbi:hypothetical protein ABIE33_007286 [Ensifer sp. 4252]